MAGLTQVSQRGERRKVLPAGGWWEDKGAGMNVSKVMPKRSEPSAKGVHEGRAAPPQERAKWNSETEAL